MADSTKLCFRLRPEYERILEAKKLPGESISEAAKRLLIGLLMADDSITDNTDDSKQENQPAKKLLLISKSS